MVKRLHVSQHAWKEALNDPFSCSPTATKVFVSSRLFRVGHSAQWTKARVLKYSGNCKWTLPYIRSSIKFSHNFRYLFAESSPNAHSSPFIHTVYTETRGTSTCLMRSYPNGGSARVHPQENTMWPRSFLSHTGRRSVLARIWR